MWRKTFVPAVLAISLILLVMLDACGAPPPSTAYFRRVETYTTASEVKDLLNGFNGGDLAADQAVEFVNRWASAKYQTAKSPTAGYDARARLSIPYGHVGILHVGPYQLILPPRTYPNLPTGDDELQDAEALCVGPNTIAWRFDFSAKQEVREARPECYLMPKAGWEVVPTLRVGQGQVAYRMQEDGSYQFEGPTPGAYPSEIASRWVVTAATQIAPGSFGIYIRPDGTPVALNGGVHYDVVPSFVNVYKNDAMRYRTLKTDVHYDPSNSPGSAECFSELCGTPIDKIPVTGTQRLATFNVDVGFRVMDPINNPSVLAKYANMGSLSSAMVNYVEGPAREAVRSVGADMTQQQLESERGKAEFEKRVLDKVQGRLDRDNIPLQISYVNLRGRDFNDADLRTAAAAAEIQLQKENDRIAAANAHAKAIEAETAGYEALQRQITLKMDTISKVINTSDGISCMELALLGDLGLADVDLSKTKEICATGRP